MRSTSVVSMLLLACACGGEAPPPEAPPPPAPPVPEAVVTAAPPPPPKPPLAMLIADANRSLIEAFNAHDAKRMASAYTADALVTDYGRGEDRGREDVATSMAGFFAAFPDARMGVGRAWLNKDVEAVEWVATGTNTGDLGPIRATKKPMGVMGFSVLWFDGDGLVAKEHRYTDSSTMLAQLGVEKGHVRAVLPLPKAELHPSHGTPDEDKNLAAMRSWSALVNGQKADAYAMLADDVVLDDYTSPAPTAGRRVVTDLFRSYFKAFPDMAEKEAGAAFASDDFTVAELVMTGTQKGKLGPLAASGNPVTVHEVEVLQWKDGKVIRGWAYGNGKELFDQLAPPTAARDPFARGAAGPARKK